MQNNGASNDIINTSDSKKTYSSTEDPNEAVKEVLK